MTTLFAKTFRHALRTFDTANKNNFSANFEFLKKLVEQLTIQDFIINENLFSEEAFSVENKAPCSYIHIYENSNVIMNIFVLKPSYQMPLHDHPGMHGILKVISGNILVESYSPMYEQYNSYNLNSISSDDNLTESDSNQSIDILTCKKVIKEQTKLLKENDLTILTPEECNYHEIKALNGIAAFFDILSPPYDDIYRKCNFYSKLILEQNPNIFILNQISAPNSYYCDSIQYTKPKWLLKYHEDLSESD